MKIHHVGPMNVNPYQRQYNRLEKQASSANKKDQVEISEAAKELQEAAKWESARQEKVEKLKQQVQNGTYTIDPKAIAKSMIRYYRNQ
ncbi:flagellar biosynthesis anti-sigma factor FlgM [Saccharococcus thermophilus]|uniref:Negative regulator of flagellin synthesis n=1 Tax=Saccharococcus thermophilus TaxID=29396 RepID=A0A846MA91_9BACL|nr:flagellar biosynthesis anti-sigma factor FlgM [Saccharococcus thermophilus]NIK13931.1 negative regulator of flagellin synthesis FlgM [Saccharococcus thermophilus]